MVLADPAPTPFRLAPRDRAVDGLLACIARHGLAKTTLEDVAAAAGCSRATLYRHFTNKHDLVACTVEAETERLRTTIAGAAAPAPTLTEALTAVVVTTAAFVDEHAALQFLFDHEPQTVLPWLAFDRGDDFLAVAAPIVGAPLERFVGAEPALRIGEWVTRLLLSSLTFADERADLVDSDRARELVEQFIVPVAQALAVPTRGVVA